MKNRFLIPALAIFFAIGMSFATEKTESDPNTDYVKINGTFMSLNQEYDCGEDKNIPCQIRLQSGQVTDLYDSPSPGDQKAGDGRIINQ